MFVIVWKVNGKVSYCTSTKYIATSIKDHYFSTDIYQAAQLGTAENVISIIRSVRKKGFEEVNGGELSYAEVELKISAEVEVPREARKHGYAICTSTGEYYTGTKALRTYYTSGMFNGNMYEGTVFESAEKAQAVLDYIIQYYKDDINALMNVYRKDHNSINCSREMLEKVEEMIVVVK